MSTLAEEIARKHNPPIYRDSGKLDSDYHYQNTVKALNEMAERIFEQTRERAVKLSNSDAVREMKFSDIAEGAN